MPGTAGPLLETIRSSAVTAAAEQVTAARTEAETIRSSARERAERARARAVALHERDAANALSRTRAETAARVGRDTLTARAAALERIFAAAERGSLTLTAHPGLPALLVATFDEAASYFSDGVVKVRCSAAIAPLLRAALEAAGRRNFDVQVAEGAPLGITVEAADGAAIVDATFPRRLARERPRLSAALAGQLAGRAK